MGRHAGWLHAFRADVSRAAAAAAAAGCRPLPSPAYSAGGAGAGAAGAFTVRAGDKAFVIRIDPAPAGA